MPRPKLHKREETLRKALSFFWKNGFSGGSTRELGQALEMHPGSIYSSFGSKENLCMETIELYAKESGQKFEECMDHDDFFEGLADYLQQLVNEDENPCVCFLVKASSSQLASDQNLARRARELVNSFREGLAARIARAKEANKLKSGLDPKAFACLIQAQVMGLRCLADSKPDSDILKAAVRDVIGLLRIAGAPSVS